MPKLKNTSHKRISNSIAISLVLNVTFLFLTSPIVILYAGTDQVKRMIENDGRAHLADVVAQLLIYSNSGINFYLYCLTGTKFRRELLAIFGRTNRVGTAHSISVTEGSFR
jgi:hypothetical protein